MATTKEYKDLALSLLDAFKALTREHVAMVEVVRKTPGVVQLLAQRPLLAQRDVSLKQIVAALAEDAVRETRKVDSVVDAAFDPLRSAIVSESDFRPALEALLKLPPEIR
jgi:hypothetical protein